MSVCSCLPNQFKCMQLDLPLYCVDGIFEQEQQKSHYTKVQSHIPKHPTSLPPPRLSATFV